MKKLKLGFMLMVVLITACSPGTVLDKVEEVPNRQWAVATPVHFSFEITDTQFYYNHHLKLRVTNDYPFENIWLKFHLKGPGGIETEEVKMFQLANKNGRWLGSGFGDLYTFERPLFLQKTYQTAGKYQLSVSQHMRRDTLTAVSDLGLRIEKGDEVF